MSDSDAPYICDHPTSHGEPCRICEARRQAIVLAKNASPSPAPKLQGMTALDVTHITSAALAYIEAAPDPLPYPPIPGGPYEFALLIRHLTRELAQARAEGAVLFDALHKCAVKFREYQKLHLAKNPPDLPKANANAWMARDAEAAMASRAPQATAFLSQLSQAIARAERAEKNQRTPGTKEVCELCGLSADLGAISCNDLRVVKGVAACPIRGA